MIVAVRNAARKDLTSRHSHWMPATLTLIIVAMVAGMVWLLLRMEAPPANKEVLYLIAGQVIGAFSTAVAYWLGSSRGSVEKQAQIENERATKPRPTRPTP